MQYKKWTLRLKNSNTDIENNILQKDSADKLQEKLVSLGVSSLLVYIVTAILGLFGFAIAGVWIVVFFAIGWVLSKYINKKIFGVERKIDDLTEAEKSLFQKLDDVYSKHIEIREKIKDKSILVHFTSYPQLKREFNEVLNMLVLYDKSKLALKYRYKHTLVTNKYKLTVAVFDEIYANKKRGI